jgi:hypothetical protein
MVLTRAGDSGCFAPPSTHWWGTATEVSQGTGEGLTDWSRAWAIAPLSRAMRSALDILARTGVPPRPYQRGKLRSEDGAETVGEEFRRTLRVKCGGLGTARRQATDGEDAPWQGMCPLASSVQGGGKVSFSPRKAYKACGSEMHERCMHHRSTAGHCSPLGRDALLL